VPLPRLTGGPGRAPWPFKQVFVERTVLPSRPWFLKNVEDCMTGIVRKGAGAWKVQRMVGEHYHTFGSLDDACPAWLAGGAVFMLDRRWQ
jgi:hypothetical protein